jgi:hypothetical protein
MPPDLPSLPFREEAMQSDALIEEPCLEALIIDQMLEFFGPYGERWTQHEHCDADGNRCLIGALLDAKHKLWVNRDRTIRLIFEAIYGRTKGGIKAVCLIEAWNDGQWRTFDEIAAVLVHARNLAASRC